MHHHWVEFLPKKSDVVSCLQRWKLQAEHETDLKLQCLKSDGGKEFRSKVFEEWLVADSVIHEKSAPYEHKQNGLAERGIQHQQKIFELWELWRTLEYSGVLKVQRFFADENISQRAMCQLFSANMLEGFWPYTVKTAVYLINCSMTSTLHDKTPLEAWMGKWPCIRHLCMFGEISYVHIPPETQKKWTKKSCPCHFLGYTPRSQNYKMWDPEWQRVVFSPNVDFSELAHLSADPNWHLHSLRDAFGIHNSSHVETGSDVKWIQEVSNADSDVSEWESDTEILQPKATEDEEVPNGSDPVVPLIPREPDTSICRCHWSEVEWLADAARPPPTQERRRPHAAIGKTYKSIVGAMRDDIHASVGVVEITGKDAEKARKHAYHEVLLAAKNTHLHNKPIDVNNMKQKPNWPKWKAAMQEELNSLEQHGTYKQGNELPPGRKVIGYTVSKKTDWQRVKFCLWVKLQPKEQR